MSSTFSAKLSSYKMPSCKLITSAIALMSLALFRQGIELKLADQYLRTSIPSFRYLTDAEGTVALKAIEKHGIHEKSSVLSECAWDSFTGMKAAAKLSAGWFPKVYRS